MTLNQILTEKHISKYRLSKNSGVPYMTINDICSGKTNLAECSSKTVYKIARELHVSMEELLEPYLNPRPSFDLFKSNVCHRLKKSGDIPFLIDTLESEEINTYYRRRWYPECLYLLAMVDYISRENEVPLCDEYNELRRLKLPEEVYPNSVIAAYAVSKDENIKQKAKDASIPEFVRFNIIENEVRDVI